VSQLFYFCTLKNRNEIRDLLETKYQQYNTTAFIEKDPVSIPHRFSRKEDIEISGFLAATISWGNRNSILKNASILMDLMDNSPHDFIKGHTARDRKRFNTFVHRTFNGVDCMYFMKALQHIYNHRGGLEGAFSVENGELRDRIIAFRKIFFQLPSPSRTGKHVSDPGKKSSAKRICMFLRWMVRKDGHGVDFGIWRSLSPADLMLPLDVHTGNVGRSLGLLTRKQNDWTAVEEITRQLRTFDPSDPVKYDFALFGMGVNKDLSAL
jgi:uncharacterized protein (TIGR02757 family)